MAEILEWLFSTQPLPIAITVVVLLLAFLFLLKFDKFRTFVKIPKKKKKVKRSCSDCMIISFHRWINYMEEVQSIKNNIIDVQERFAEEKIKEITIKLQLDYKSHQMDIRSDEENQNPDLEEEQKEYILYEEALHNAFRLVKEEILRTFLENGFHELSGERFSLYVKNKTKDLIRIGKQYMLTKYPPHGMKISLESRFDRLDEKYIEDVTFDVYVNAKSIRNNAEYKIEKIKEDFKKDQEEFISGEKQ